MDHAHSDCDLLPADVTAMNEITWLNKAQEHSMRKYQLKLSWLIRQTGRRPDAEEMRTMSPDSWVDEVMNESE